MNILLIKPCWPYPFSGRELTYNRIWPPLSLANCAAILEREGYLVDILDAHAERIPAQNISERASIRKFDKIFVTSSSLDRWQCPNLDLEPFFDTVKEVKKYNDKVFLTGYHGTVEPEEILERTGARAIIRGEPEFTVLEICQEKNFSDINGITYKKDGKIISNPQKEPLDLGALPIAAFHLLKFHKYFYELLGRDFALIEGSRGCPHACEFCSKAMFGQGVRRKIPQRIIQEIDSLVNNFGVKRGYFIDLNFTADKTWALNLCDLLIQRKYDFRWCCQARPNEVDEALLLKMRAAGCKLIHYGVESGSEMVLKSMNKEITLEEIKRGVLSTNKIGIKTMCFFIFGFPAETKADMDLTLSFAKRLRPTYASFRIAVAYSGSGLRAKAEYSHVVLRALTRSAFLRFYLRPAYLIRKIFSDGLWISCRQLIIFFNFLIHK